MGRKSKSTASIPPANEFEPDGNVAVGAEPPKKTRKPRTKTLFILEELSPDQTPGSPVHWRDAVPGTTFDDRKSAEAYPETVPIAGTFRVVPLSTAFTIKLEQTIVAKRD